MIAIKVIKHSFLQVLGNFGDALKVSLVLLAVGAIVSTVAVRWLFGNAFIDVDLTGIRALIWVVNFFNIFISALIAVSWHRFVLYNERPTSWFPKMRFDLAFKYIGKLIIIGLLLLLVLVPVIVLIGAAYIFAGYGVPPFGGGPIGSNGAGVIGLMAFVGIALTSYIVLRLCVLLPAAALGRVMGVKEAWRATADLGFGLWLIAILEGALIAANQYTSLWLFGLPGGNVISFVIGWVFVMFQVSLVTTIYGYCVEKRDLI